MIYRLKVNQQWKIVVALIVCPLFFVLIFIPAMLQFKNLPDWIVLAASFALIGVSAGFTLLVVMKWLTIECEIDMNDQYFHFKSLQQTPFMHIHEFSSNWENIENISLNEDAQHDSVFYTVQFRQPNLTLSLTDIPKQTIGSYSAFWEELNRHNEEFNTNSKSPEMKIHDIGFYEKPWTKIFTYAILILAVLGLVATIFTPDENSWWKIITFCVFVIPWMINYYRAKRNRETKTNE